MSGTKSKYIIGLTGNIGTGKSVVRRMLGHLGAYGIDADALGHRAIARGAPGYQPVIELFGRWILNTNGEIDRKRLAKIVFENPSALESLENIIHPLVSRAIDLLIQRTPHQIVVVEAIKLFESGLASRCDAAWVTYTPEVKQVERLVEKRGMSQVDALSRIRVQSSQRDKISKASLVIINDSSFERIWKQVYDAWNKIPLNVEGAVPEEQVSVRGAQLVAEAGAAMAIRRGSPREAQEIALLLNQIKKPEKELNRLNVIESFGEKAYLLLYGANGEDLLGLMTWQVENLVARVFDILIQPEVFQEEAVMMMLKHVEEESKTLQAEVCMVFMPEEHGIAPDLLRKLGYQTAQADDLDSSSWLEAAREGLDAGQQLYIKVLRTQRVLRPV